MNLYLSTILANVVPASSAATIAIITLIILCAIGLAVGITLYLRKQKEQMARIAAQLAEQEAARKAMQEEQERLRMEAETAAACEIQSVEEANTYQIDQFVCSTDMGDLIQPLTRPVRVIPGEEQTTPRKYNLVVHGSDAGKPLYYALTKPVNSVGRASNGKKGNADICIATTDKSISRVHAVLTYKAEEKRDGITDPAFWMLAVNQFSDRNPGEENVRKAVMVTENGQQVLDIAFMINGKQKIFLNNTIYLTIE